VEFHVPIERPTQTAVRADASCGRHGPCDTLRREHRRTLTAGTALNRAGQPTAIACDVEHEVTAEGVGQEEMPGVA
jgi:hypothetical protein